MRTFAIGLCLALLGPQWAWAADPFRSAPGPGSDPFRMAPEASPKPAPHRIAAPRLQREPQMEPDVLIPQPAQPAVPIPQPAQPVTAAMPKLPPSDVIAARVREIGQAQGIAVPLAEPNVRIDEAGTPTAFRALLGAWGPAAWSGSGAQNKIILIVLSVDVGGNGRVIYASSSGPNFSPNWQVRPARVSGGKITFENPNPNRGGPPVSHEYAVERDGYLHGVRNKTAFIALPPLR